MPHNLFLNERHANVTKTYHVEKDDTLVYALGGLGEVGKNMYCLEHDDEILIIDCGVLFPGDELLGVDYVIPDYHHLIRMNKKHKVLIITHGHEDHIGGIPFLLRQVKIDAIYAPRFAKALIQKKLAEHHGLETTKITEINDVIRFVNKTIRHHILKNQLTGMICGFYLLMGPRGRNEALNIKDDIEQFQKFNCKP
jgi:ribonuclease J